MSDESYRNNQDKEAVNKDSEEKYRLLFELSHQPIIITTEDGRFIDVNTACLDLYGYEKKELMDVNAQDFWANPEERLIWQKKMHNDGFVYDYECIHKAKDGRHLFIQVSSTLRNDSADGLIYQSIIRDITGEKRAKKETDAGKKRYQDLFDNAPVMYVITKKVDGKPIIKEVNSKFIDTLGYSRDELIGQSLEKFYTKESVYQLYEGGGYQKALKGNLSEVERSLITKKGRIIHALASAVPEKDEEGNIISLRSIYLDISDRKQTEDALKESEEKYRAMMESMIDGAYICSSDYRIEYMNPAMIRNIGKDATGELCFNAIYRRNAPCENCVLEKVLQGKKINQETMNRRRTYLVSHSPIFHDDGTVSKLSIYRDISEQRKMEKQIQQTRKIESIGTLAGGIAHDFNNILTSIIGFTELSLTGVETDSELEDNLQEVYAAGKRAKELVKQILAFARQSDEEIKPIQVSDIAKEVLKFIRSSIPASIQIKQKIESDSVVMANPTQIHQVLMNLCTNAYQAMGEAGGRLEVTITDKIFPVDSFRNGVELNAGDYIQIKISDTGTGIEPEIIHSIFEPYFTTKPHGEGTGMGLAMVQGIVETYGGTINVKSKWGKGSTFTIYIPIVKHWKKHASFMVEDMPLGNERILFVDDELPIAKMGQRLLTQLGYSVETRTSSVEALALFKAKPDEFDLVITDMTMPNMTGDILTTELIAIRPEVPVILCTGYSKKISEANAKEIGFKAFAYKPIVHSDLAKTVRRVLDGELDSASLSFS